MSVSTGRTCKNCGHSLELNYCPNCGQRDIESGITLKETIGDFFSSSFAIDGPIWTTLKLLVTNPGMLFREFIEGRRKSYYKPVQFFIVVTVVYLGTVSLLGHNPLEGQFSADPKLTINQQEAVEHTKKAADFMVRHINNFLFFLVFALAAVMKIAAWRKNTFAEYLAIGFYIAGTYILLGTINVSLIELGLSVREVQFPLLAIYVTYAHISFRGGFKWKRLFAGFLIAWLSIFMYVAGAYGTAFVYVFLTR